MKREIIMRLAKEANLDMWDGGSMGSSEFCSNYKEMEKFAQLIIDECIDAVIESDPSEKLIVHEPYRSIINAIEEKFEVE